MILRKVMSILRKVTSDFQMFSKVTSFGEEKSTSCYGDTSIKAVVFPFSINTGPRIREQLVQI